MSETQNAALARRWFHEVWNERKDATVRELLLHDAVCHMEGQEVRGPEAFLEARDVLLGAFPDLSVVVDDTVAQGDQVVVRWTAKGTHQGAQLGIAATAEPVLFRGLTWIRFEGGKAAEGWDAWNQGGLVMQLQAVATKLAS